MYRGQKKQTVRRYPKWERLSTLYAESEMTAADVTFDCCGAQHKGLQART